MKSWFLLYTTRNLAEASIIKGLLQENLIKVMVMNKQDSSYPAFGEIELYVPIHFKNIATHLLDKALLN
jgi:hypothetical protein